MNPTLTVLKGSLNGSVFVMTNAAITIGREPSNDLSIPDRLLSRRHCRIARLAADNCTLTDLGSANGTFVNGVPVKERALAHGDLIQVGESLLLFETEANSAATTVSGFVQWDEAPLSETSTLTLPREAALDWNAERLHQLSLNARLAQEFQALLRIGLELNMLRTPAEIQQRLLALLGAVVPAERGVFLLRDQGELEFGCGFGWEGSTPTAPAACVSRTIVQRVGQEGVAILYHNVPTQTELQQAKSLLYAGVQSVLAVPLAAGAHVFGILYLDTRNEAARFDAWHLQLATALANLTAHALQRARELQAAEAETQRLQAELSQELVGESAAIQHVRARLAQFAPTDATVLILGESGTGKEVVARALHNGSPRAKKPFIALNCATLDTLLESELFGHEKGAFTGAHTQKKGKLELADGGTVFLDEIGEMKPELQAKLLRVLETRECERLGGNRTIKLDIRILAATNRELKAAIKDGSFRADLYHRLNVFALTLPPLRERREDIELLARFFINHFAKKTGRRVHSLDPAASQCLQNYDWPGNVRDLRNAIEHAVTLNTIGVVLPEDLPRDIYEAEPQLLPPAPLPPTVTGETTISPSSGTALKYRDAVKTARKQIILQAFQQSGDNHQAAAQLLGLHPNNLHREIRLLNLRPQLK